MSPIHASVNSMNLDDTASNAETMEYYFAESVADLVTVGPDHYRTSVDRTVDLTVKVEPREFEPLIEWRVDNVAESLSAGMQRSFHTVDVRYIEVGPQSHPSYVVLETYSVTTTHDASSPLDFNAGVPITYTAVTDPPGLEDEVRWLASTKFGTTDVVVGTGPHFTVGFSGTWGALNASGTRMQQWVGVRGGNDYLGQDQKGLTVLHTCPPGMTCVVTQEGNGAISTTCAAPVDPGCVNRGYVRNAAGTIVHAICVGGFTACVSPQTCREFTIAVGTAILWDCRCQ